MQNTVRWRSDLFWYICHFSWRNNYLEHLVKQKWTLPAHECRSSWKNLSKSYSCEALLKSWELIDEFDGA